MLRRASSIRTSSRDSGLSLWGVIKTAVFLAVLLGAGWLLFKQTVQDQLKDAVSDKLNQKLAGSGLVVRIGQAQLIQGEGISLSNLEVDFATKQSTESSEASQATFRSGLSVYEMFVYLDANLADLATTELQPRALELKRARLTLVRQSDGQWDFEPIIERLGRLSTAEEQTIPILLSDCEVQVVDLSRPGTTPITVSGVHFSVHQIEHQGRTLWQINGDFQTRLVSQIGLTAYLDLENQFWYAKLKASGAMLSHDLLTLAGAAETTDPLKTLSGSINFEVDAEGDFQFNEVPRFKMTGSVAQLSVDDLRLPVPIQNASASFVVTERGFQIEEAHGGLGRHGSFHVNYSQTGILERQRWRCEGQVNGFDFERQPRLLRWLPDYAGKFCDDFAPRGTSNVTFTLSHDGQTLKRKIIGQLTDMSFAFVKMPYRVDHCRGDVRWIDNRCEFDVKSNVGEQPVSLDGFADNIGKGATYQVDIHVPGTIPIDRKLLEATDAQPKLARVIRAFKPTGHVGGVGRIQKRVTDGPVERSFNVRLSNCGVRHDGFDYPIYNIDGLVEVRGDEYTFRDLRGNNNSGKVGCNGTWNPTTGLALRFLCQSVPLNDQLRYALKPEIREIWNGFRPRGKLDLLKVDMTLPPGGELDLDVEATLKESRDDAEANYVSIYPVWFPYQINHLTGRVKIGKGKIQLTDMRGQHQKTWVSCGGQGHYSDQSWSLRLSDTLVSSLKVDEDLLAAIPRSMAPALAQLRYRGLVNVNGDITLAGTKVPSPLHHLQRQLPGDEMRSRFTETARFDPADSNTSLAWKLRVDMNQSSMQVGLPLENVFGTVHLIGTYDGQTLDCDGELDIDSLTVYDTQITSVQGPIRIQNDRVTAGMMIEPATKELAPGTLQDGTLNVDGQSVLGVLHGGMVRLDARLDSGDRNSFYVQATLADSCLGTACRELAPGLEDVEGSSYGSIRLRGDGSGTHSHRGEGSIQLRDAKIYELPVMLSLLKILNVRQLSRTAFDSGNIDFTVVGETINFERMEFIGDAISLIGNGEMNLDRDINLNFYSVMGRNRINIPLISDLYKASSQRVLWIKVDGKLDDPQTHRNVLPGMNDSLKQLFQPRRRERIAKLRQDRLVRPAGASLPIGNSYFQQEFAPTFRSQVIGQ